MTDILEEIVAHKRQEIELFYRFLPMRQLMSIVEGDMAKRKEQPLVSMREVLTASDTGIISEFKRKSPSKGWINKDAKPDIVPLQYQANGASAISILTDTDFFGGYDEYIMCARESGITIPILYKNFIIDEYQLLQAYHSGASAVLLIAACLDKEQCRHLISVAHQLQMEVLLEIHAESELDYVDLMPDMYGINNRNLGTFVTDVRNSFRMAELLPADACKVSESGLSDVEIIRQLRELGFRGFLMGEHFMRQQDPGKALGEFIASLCI